MGSYREDMSLFGFLVLFGFGCSGFWCDWDICDCSGCSVDFVEKMWETLCGSRWENVVKVSTDGWKSRVFGWDGGINEKFCVNGGKFYEWIYTWFYPYKNSVLHSFHIAYYYDY